MITNTQNLSLSPVSVPDMGFAAIRLCGLTVLSASFLNAKTLRRRVFELAKEFLSLLPGQGSFLAL